MSFVKCYFVRSRWRKLKRLFEDESWRQALKLRRKYREIATWQLLVEGITKSTHQWRMLWIRIQYFSLAVLLDPLAWKLGPARINQEDGTHDLACVRAALRPFPLHYYHCSRHTALYTVSGVMTCQIFIIRCYCNIPKTQCVREKSFCRLCWMDACKSV